MKIEKITDNKIRIILDIDEIEENNLDFLSITQNTDEAKKLFKKILKKAEKEVDFQFEDSRLLIEAFISADGFFIIIFTKLPENQNSPIGNSLKINVKKKRSSLKHNYIYQFNSFDEFCDFCTYLKNFSLDYSKTFTKGVSLYEYNSKYFLVLSNFNNEDIYLFNVLITEFAKKLKKAHNFDSLLLEYGNVVFKNYAIKNGIKYFCK